MKTNPTRRALVGLSILQALSITFAFPLTLAAGVVDCDGAWHTQATPSDHDFQELFGVSAVSSTDTWAGGTYTDFSRSSNSQPLMLHYDGSTWTEVDGPRLPDGGTVRGVAAISSTDVWMVGGRGEIPARTLVEHWNGSQWAVVPSPSPGLGSTGSSLLAVAAVSSTDAWAVGLRSFRDEVLTLVEHWDGSTWTVIQSPNVPGYNTNAFDGVAAISANDVWAAGSAAPDVGSVASALVEHWDGVRWSMVPTPTGPLYNDVFSAISAGSSTDVWAVGTYEGNQGNSLSLTEHWDGTQWAFVPSPSPGQAASLVAASTLPTGTAWAVGGGGNSLMSLNWEGARWRPMRAENPGDLASAFLGVDALSDRSVWAVGYFANNDGVIRTLSEYYC